MHSLRCWFDLDRRGGRSRAIGAASIFRYESPSRANSIALFGFFCSRFSRALRATSGSSLFAASISSGVPTTSLAPLEPFAATFAVWVNPAALATFSGFFRFAGQFVSGGETRRRSPYHSLPAVRWRPDQPRARSLSPSRDEFLRVRSARKLQRIDLKNVVQTCKAPVLSPVARSSHGQE